MSKFVEGKVVKVHSEEPAATSANIALGVNDLPSMKKFYQEILGFELMGEFPSAALLKVSRGRSSQSQKLGLLQRSVIAECGTSEVEHIAFVMPVPDPDMERKRLEALGLKVAAMNLDGLERGLLSFRDPEGNEIELLCCRPMLDN